MIGDFTVCALIPARGGSKRIPHKNIRELAGKPLLWHTATEARRSTYIDRCIVSSDDTEIIALAKTYDIEAPFVRPAELAGDDSTDLEVVEHALHWLEEHEAYVPDIVVQLRVTSPLRTAADIDNAIKLLAEHPEADSVRTVMEVEHSPYKMFKMGEGGYLAPILSIAGEPEPYNLPGQRLPKVYQHVGYADVIWRKTIMQGHSVTGSKILPLVLPKAHRGIDTPEDWERYEMLMKDTV